jgi:hypothetical protein
MYSHLADWVNMSGATFVTKSVFDQGSSSRTMFLTAGSDSLIHDTGQSLHVAACYATTSGAGGE